jgi:hypothetical protein
MKVIERRKNQKEKTNLLFRGGAVKAETANLIVSSIKDEISYIVKDRKLTKSIYRLAKENFKFQSLIITPNLPRFLVLKLASENNTMVVRFQNFLLLSDSPVRLLIRGGSALTVGIITALTSVLPFAVLVLFVTFSQTENCGFQCEKYFQEIRPQDNGALMVYAPQSTGSLIITSKNSAQRVEISIPDQAEVRPNPIIKKVEGKTTISRKYKKVEAKAKMVTFSQFKEKDPVLKALGEIEEPNIPTKSCPFTPEQIRDHI